MRRRDFIAGLVSVAAWPAVAPAQQSAQRMRRIGILNGFNERDPVVRSFVEEMIQALARLGWENGHNVQIVQRWAAGDLDRIVMQAEELISLQPDVIIAAGTPAAIALKKETNTLPVVFVIVTDPVGAGVVASLARPGGNITGFSNVEGTFGGKLLSLLKMMAPRIRRAAAMFNPDTAPGRGLYHLGSFEAAARSLGIEPITAEVRSDAEIEQAIISLGREQGGVVATPDVFMSVHRGTMIASSIRNGVPTIFDGVGFAKEGGLLQYGAQGMDIWRRSASYVDRILRGTKPGDLPVELPIKYTFTINLKTAKALGLDFSPDKISIADEVFE